MRLGQTHWTNVTVLQVKLHFFAFLLYISLIRHIFASYTPIFKFKYALESWCYVVFSAILVWKKRNYVILSFCHWIWKRWHFKAFANDSIFRELIKVFSIGKKPWKRSIRPFHIYFLEHLDPRIRQKYKQLKTSVFLKILLPIYLLFSNIINITVNRFFDNLADVDFRIDLDEINTFSFGHKKPNRRSTLPQKSVKFKNRAYMRFLSIFRHFNFQNDVKYEGTLEMLPNFFCWINID